MSFEFHISYVNFGWPHNASILNKQWSKNVEKQGIGAKWWIKPSPLDSPDFFYVRDTTFHIREPAAFN